MHVFVECFVPTFLLVHSGNIFVSLWS